MSTQAALHPALLSMAQDCPESLADEEVMCLLCHADDYTLSQSLFSELFRRYHSRVTSWCFRFTRNRCRALDLAQEVFFRAYRHRHGFRGDSRLSTWLYAITRNQCLSTIGKVADPVNNGAPVPVRLPDLSAIPPDVALERKQRREEMWRVIGSVLDPVEARVMALHYAYEWPLAAITKTLDLTNPSGAKAYVVNARRKIDRVMKRRALLRSISRTAA